MTIRLGEVVGYKHLCSAKRVGINRRGNKMGHESLIFSKNSKIYNDIVFNFYQKINLTTTYHNHSVLSCMGISYQDNKSLKKSYYFVSFIGKLPS